MQRFQNNASDAFNPRKIDFLVVESGELRITRCSFGLRFTSEKAATTWSESANAVFTAKTYRHHFATPPS